MDIETESEIENEIESEMFSIYEPRNNELDDYYSTLATSWRIQSIIEKNEQTEDDKNKKRQRGRPKKNASITKNNDYCGKKHTKYSSDNIKQKLFRYFVKKFLLKNINRFMSGKHKMRLPKPNFSIKFLKLKLGDYLSFDVSPKCSNCNPDQNKNNLHFVKIPHILDMKLLYIFEEGFIKGKNIFTNEESNYVICGTYSDYKKQLNDEKYLRDHEQVVIRLMKPIKIFDIIKETKKSQLIYLN